MRHLKSGRKLNRSSAHRKAMFRNMVRSRLMKRGGVGFFSDSGEMANLYWMKVAQQDDFVGRVCAYFYPNPVQARSQKRPQ